MSEPTGWICPRCGHDYVWHGLKNGRPVCQTEQLKTQLRELTMSQSEQVDQLYEVRWVPATMRAAAKPIKGD